jgi:hypothetical protein
MSGRRRERLLKEYSADMVGPSKSISRIELAEQIAAYHAFDNDRDISKDDFNYNVGRVLNNLLVRGTGPFSIDRQEADTQAEQAQSDFNEMVESSYTDQEEARVALECWAGDRSNDDKEHIEADDAQNDYELDQEIDLWRQTGPFGPQRGSSSIAMLNAFHLGNRVNHRTTVRTTGDLVGTRNVSRYYGITKWIPRDMRSMMDNFLREQESVRTPIINEYKDYFDDRVICMIYLARGTVMRGKMLDLKVFALLIEKEVEYRDQFTDDELCDAKLVNLTRRHMYKILATIRAQERPWDLFLRPLSSSEHPSNPDSFLASSREFGLLMREMFPFLTDAEVHLAKTIHMTCNHFEKCDHIISSTDWNRPIFGVSLLGMQPQVQSVIREEIRTKWYKTHDGSLPTAFWDFSVMHADFSSYFPVEE